MGRKSRRGGQYMSNVGYSNGYATPHTPGFLRGTDVGLANPTPFGATRTMAGGMFGFEKIAAFFTGKKPEASSVGPDGMPVAPASVGPDGMPVAPASVGPTTEAPASVGPTTEAPAVGPDGMPVASTEMGGGRRRSSRSRRGFRRRSSRSRRGFRRCSRRSGRSRRR
jgi:hypothetical protein